MSTDRTIRLNPQGLAIKLACIDAVRAGGGQEFVAGEVSRAQSRISDYCSPNTADFMPADLIVRVEALSAGAPGHPHITRALARAQGGCFVAADAAPSLSAPLAHWLAEVAGESGDVIKAMALATERFAELPVPPASRATLAQEVDQLIDVLSRFAASLKLPSGDTS